MFALYTQDIPQNKAFYLSYGCKYWGNSLWIMFVLKYNNKKSFEQYKLDKISAIEQL